MPSSWRHCFASSAVAAASFEKCGPGIRAQVLRSGIRADIVNAAFRDIKFDEKAVRFSRTQPEYRLAIWDYMAFLVDDVRIADGLKMMKTHERTLRDVERAYGVDRFILAALWGVESNYGQEKGDFFLPHALSNVACAGRKPRVFKTELIQALRIVAAGDVKLADLTGSWAGAFGQTQFMPSTYRRLAVDFDRDGHRDTIHSVPDALASAAQLSEESRLAIRPPMGLRGEYFPVLPQSAGRTKKLPISHWAKRGSAVPMAPRSRKLDLWVDKAGGPFGPRLPGLAELRCALFLQCSAVLCAGYLSSLRSAPREGAIQDRVADRRSRADASRAQASPGAAD